MHFHTHTPTGIRLGILWAFLIHAKINTNTHRCVGLNFLIFAKCVGLHLHIAKIKKFKPMHLWVFVLIFAWMKKAFYFELTLSMLGVFTTELKLPKSSWTSVVHYFCSERYLFLHLLTQKRTLFQNRMRLKRYQMLLTSCFAFLFLQHQATSPK